MHSITKGDYELVRVEQQDEWDALHTLRQAELFERKAHIVYDTNHPDDHKSHHFPLVLKHCGECVGTARLDLLNGDGEGVIRLVAVSRTEQGKGHGRVLENLFETFAKSKGVRKLFVNANPMAVGYYERLGFVHEAWNEARGELAQDCVQMAKVIA